MENSNIVVELQEVMDNGTIITDSDRTGTTCSDGTGTTGSDGTSGGYFLTFLLPFLILSCNEGIDKKNELDAQN